MAKIIACKTNELESGSMKKIAIDGREIVVANVGGNYFACDDTCTHSGASLSEGTIDGSTITCGWHGAQFDCTTGKLSQFPAKINDLKSYDVSIESEDVFIEV
ncbi:MAG: non-heme iron oxygenase ferredoxin subunit [Candidatus Nitrosopelagicus sp.]|nr:non-heme iron oxygenase ferredoxin subunit [Candidatus Nitrosopelagicus sp.]